jgi:hypothetical protein
VAAVSFGARAAWAVACVVGTRLGAALCDDAWLGEPCTYETYELDGALFVLVTLRHQCLI